MAQLPIIPWTTLPSLGDNAIADARIASHYAVQWLGRFGRAYGTPAPDDSHTSLQWDSGTSTLVNGGPAQSLSFSFSTMTLTLRASASDDVFALDGHTDADVRAWFGEAVEKIGLDPSALDGPLPYDMPESPLASGGRYDIAQVKSGVEFLEGLYRNASSLLNAVKDVDDRALPIRCWPHHFDVATLIAVEEQTSEDSRSIGVGMSPGDDNYPTPYLYVTPWPYPDVKRLKDLPGPAHWHMEGWVGAILTVRELNAASDPKNAVSQFVSSALSQANALLGKR